MCQWSKFCWRQDFFTAITDFTETKIIPTVCYNLTEKLFVGEYNDKTKAIKVLENNYIDPNCFFP